MFEYNILNDLNIKALKDYRDQLKTVEKSRDVKASAEVSTTFKKLDSQIESYANALDSLPSNEDKFATRTTLEEINEYIPVANHF